MLRLSNIFHVNLPLPLRSLPLLLRQQLQIPHHPCHPQCPSRFGACPPLLHPVHVNPWTHHTLPWTSSAVIIFLPPPQCLTLVSQWIPASPSNPISATSPGHHSFISGTSPVSTPLSLTPLYSHLNNLQT